MVLMNTVGTKCVSSHVQIKKFIVLKGETKEEALSMGCLCANKQ